MREYALPVAGVLLNLAINLSIAKDWTKRLPDLVVVVLWAFSLVPLGYWAWTHPRLLTLLRTRYAISMTVVVLLGALCGGGLTGMGYAFWYHSRSQTGTQSADSKPQEQTSEKKSEDKKKDADKKDVASTDSQKKDDKHKTSPNITQESHGDRSPNVVQQGQNNIAQFGDNNKAIINAAPPPRAVPPDKENDFKAALKAFPGGAIGILKAGSSDDVAPLQSQIKRLVKDAGWNWSCGGEISAGGETPQANGLECYSADGWNTPMAKAFKTALISANLECRYFDTAYTFDGVTFSAGTPTLVIGRNILPH